MKAGDRVVCVDPMWAASEGPAKNDDLIINQTTKHPTTKELGLAFKQWTKYAYWHGCFRKLDDNWAEEVLRIAQEESESIPLEI